VALVVLFRTSATSVKIGAFTRYEYGLAATAALTSASAAS